MYFQNEPQVSWKSACGWSGNKGVISDGRGCGKCNAKLETRDSLKETEEVGERERERDGGVVGSCDRLVGIWKHRHQCETIGQRGETVPSSDASHIWVCRNEEDLTSYKISYCYYIRLQLQSYCCKTYGCNV